MRSPGHGPSGDEHVHAAKSLNTALKEQDRLGDRYSAAVGTSSELSAYADLRAAGDRVAARQAWVQWLDRDY